MKADEAIKTVRDLDRLAVLKQFDLLDTPAEEAFDRLTHLASKITNSPISLVSLVDMNRQFFKSHAGLVEPWATIRETPLSHSFCIHVVAENAPLIIEDARQHPVLKDNLAVPELGVIGYLGIPLTTADGFGLGSFCIIDTAPRKWTDREIEIMHELARSVMTEIELRAQVKARIQAEKALQQYTNTLELEVAEQTQELRQVYEQLQGLAQLKSKFIDDISHELRTPITNFNLYLDLLIRGKPKSRAKYEAILKNESSRLVRLLDGILDFSSLQKSFDTANFMSVALNSLVAETFVNFEQAARSRDLDLSFMPSEEDLKVWGDSEQLKQVVINLLQNAISYTPAGYIHLSTQQTTKGNLIRLTVQDSGIGLDEEELSYCFKRFYRGKRIGQLNIAPGAGLGLAKVRDIVAFHRGWIEVDSEMNEGSTFSVYLPAEQSSG